MPGAEHVWRVVMQRDTPRVQVQRAEEWTWLVRGIDGQGHALLEGRLTGLGAGVDIDDEPMPDDLLNAALSAEQQAEAPVTMRMGIDGRLHDLDATGFSASLPHRLLAQVLPGHAVLPGDPWSDTALPRAFTDLFPIDMATRMRGETRFVGVDPDGVVLLESSGHARADGGPAIALRGTTRWDPTLGMLQSRELTAELRPEERDPVRGPGVLRVRVERV